MEINTGTARLNSLYEEYIQKYIRVLKLARTPSRDEFTKIALVAAIGVFVIGLIGFTIYELMLVLPH
ncbi:MAG: protein translocase SEC61 complex subunit gamma [Methanofollis sp.]|uniref:protein translocase SEC61 complex subunit gamma n=1 Tax=Methanofollis sp. TaxID=2052835 RepID=UPI0026188D09|nr:protein translocase SEC61 complex subunit gamma [Methanofollis sp.]MDD4255780.1 protein translocase SEC61 complex subunit gamma [Methanofollis sp.]